MAIELPEGYYLTNFQELLDYVVEQYDDLLSSAEKQFCDRFLSLSEPAKMLYVRMLTRKGELFRDSKLNYREIPDTVAAANELADAQLIDIAPGSPVDSLPIERLPIDPLLGIFSKPEWIHMLGAEVDTATFKALRRAELDDQLRLHADIAARAVSQSGERLYQVAAQQHFTTFKLLFFGNLNQDLTEFVLRDLGLYRFEDYHIDHETRLFQSRQQIENYLAYYQLLETLDQTLSGDVTGLLQLHHALPDAEPQDATLYRRIQRVNIKLARQLERLHALDEALAIYRLCSLPPARERSARILVKQGHVDEALRLCRDIAETPRGEEEAVFAAEFGYRTANRHQQSWPKPLTYTPPSETVSLLPAGQGVELAVVEALSPQGDCYFVENGLFSSLFGLHFWEVIFAPVQGAFCNPFQIRPLDLYDREFVTRRAKAFQQAETALVAFDQQTPQLLNRYQQKQGTATSFVYWELLSESLIRKALNRIPASHWKLIFDRLWSDLRANRSGFPDLILFPEQGGYELIEVKGPGDRLQKNQRRWMQFFAQHQIPHRVIHVEWQ